EDGVALTEYLMLLGLLVAGVIVAVTAAGTNLAAAWDSWGTFWTTTVSYSG
ncbi:Flp family type IVb pilin, partial [Roseibium sp.]|uniref:Flp family type IVb pilin n=1 Tax=Roseibium sp. TaxID=1936156 RepID=UPI003D0EBE11